MIMISTIIIGNRRNLRKQSVLPRVEGQEGHAPEPKEGENQGSARTWENLAGAFGVQGSWLREPKGSGPEVPEFRALSVEFRVLISSC